MFYYILKFSGFIPAICIEEAGERIRRHFRITKCKVFTIIRSFVVLKMLTNYLSFKLSNKLVNFLMKFHFINFFLVGRYTSSLNFKIMYKNYFIVLKLLLKNVKIMYALLRAQTPPLRCVSQ